MLVVIYVVVVGLVIVGLFFGVFVICFFGVGGGEEVFVLLFLFVYYSVLWMVFVVLIVSVGCFLDEFIGSECVFMLYMNFLFGVVVIGFVVCGFVGFFFE